MPVSTRWRVGRKVGRTIYLQRGDEPSDSDPLIGVMDTRELAVAAVCAVAEVERLRAALADALAIAVNSAETEAVYLRCRAVLDDTKAR